MAETRGYPELPTNIYIDGTLLHTGAAHGFKQLTFKGYFIISLCFDMSTLRLYGRRLIFLCLPFRTSATLPCTRGITLLPICFSDTDASLRRMCHIPSASSKVLQHQRRAVRYDGLPGLGQGDLGPGQTSKHSSGECW